MRLTNINKTALATCTVLGLRLTSLPSYAVEPDMSTADVAEDVVQSLSSNAETGPIAEAEIFSVGTDGGLIHSSPGAQVLVTPGNDPSIQLRSDSAEPLLIDAALPGKVSIADGGTAVFTSEQGYSVAPLPQEDGSVQIVTVLDSEAAPDRYDYSFSASEPITLEALDSGVVLALDPAGQFLGGVAAPWAFDAEGRAVPTHFEIDGQTLTQVVQHKGADFSYPISADPYAGKALWAWSSIDSFNGDTRVNLRLSQWGKGNQEPWILINHGWPEALNRSNALRSALTSKETMRQQFDCHAFGSAFAGDWNLERFRPNRTTVWSSGVAFHHCNWTTPNAH